MIINYSGNDWLRTDKLVGAQVVTSKPAESDGGVAPTSSSLESREPQAPQPPAPAPSRVFISHSKNRTVLDQIKTLLEFGQFQFVIAEDVETTSIPIPEKVFGLMRQCNSAIINVSADEKEKNEDGTYRVNPNVLIEIGAAFLTYNKKIILLTDKRVILPSNLQGLYKCEYEGDELSFNSAMKLQKALAGFRQLQ
jgi:predicted nucleotide-binding protein